MADRKSSSGMGSGGMVSKIEAARIATAAGIDLAIISGHGPHALARFTHTGHGTVRSEEHTSELQSLMRISYAVFCLKKKKITQQYETETSAHYELNRLQIPKTQHHTQ